MKYKFVNKRRYRYLMYPCLNAALCFLSIHPLQVIRTWKTLSKSKQCRQNPTAVRLILNKRTLQSRAAYKSLRNLSSKTGKKSYEKHFETNYEFTEGGMRLMAALSQPALARRQHCQVWYFVAYYKANIHRLFQQTIACSLAS